MLNRKMIGLGLLIALATIAVIPGWSIVEFATAMATNEEVASRVFVLLAILVIAIVVVVIYKALLSSSDESIIPKRQKQNQNQEGK